MAYSIQKSEPLQHQVVRPLLHCSGKISVTFNGQVRWLFISPLGKVLPTTNQNVLFTIFSPAMFSFTTNISKAAFTNLLGRLLLYLKFLGHRQLVCWYVSLCQFLPNHFCIWPFSPSSQCQQQPDMYQAAFMRHGWRAMAKPVLLSKKLDGARSETRRLQAPPAAASCEGQMVLSLSAAQASRNEEPELGFADCLSVPSERE